MDVRGFGGPNLLLAIGRTQSDLATATSRLASGLRVQTAADDPSGLAIAESLRAQINGLDQGSRNIQDASNAITVADGAMQTITEILQRMRTIVVQANSDLVDAAQRSNLQVEVNQLTLEINTIAQNTSFNGKSLLDGSLSSAGALPARLLIPINDSLTQGGTVLDTVTDPSQPSLSTSAEQIVQTATVTSYDPTTDQLSLTVTIASQDPSFGPTQTSVVQVPNGTNYPTFAFGPPSPGNPTFFQYDQNGTGIPVLSFNIGTLTQNDVGKSSTIISLPAQQKASGSALTVNTGSAEGSVVTADLPNVSAVSLGVNDVQLSSDPLLNMANEYRVDYALQTIGSVRATLGAQTVALHEASNNAQIASVNYASSESAIRDLSVGQEVTTFTRDQIVSQFQTTLLVNSTTMAKSFATLVSGSILNA
jgi:flagellin